MVWSFISSVLFFSKKECGIFPTEAKVFSEEKSRKGITYTRWNAFKRKALNFHSNVDVNIVNHSNLYILLNTCLKSPPAGVVVKQSAV